MWDTCLYEVHVMAQVKKHSSGPYKAVKECSSTIPPAIDDVVETIVLERIAAGEELCTDFVESTLISTIEAWNQKVDEFRASLAQATLSEADCHVSEHSTEQEDAKVHARLSKDIQTIQDALYKVNLTRTADAVRKRGAIAWWGESN